MSGSGSRGPASGSGWRRGSGSFASGSAWWKAPSAHGGGHLVEVAGLARAADDPLVQGQQLQGVANIAIRVDSRRLALPEHIVLLPRVDVLDAQIGRRPVER